MSDEKQIVNEITIFSGEGENTKEFNLSKWSWRQTVRQSKAIGEALSAVEKATGKSNLLSNLDMEALPALMSHAPEHIDRILRQSLPKQWAEDRKDMFMDNLTMVQGIRFVKAVIKLNFLDKANQAELIGLLSGDLNESAES